VARALKGLPRDQVVIVTKTTSRQANQVKDDIDRFLKEMETEVIDILLLHCLTKKDWTKSYAGAMEVLTNAKTQGKVRAVGVSCHGFGALKTAAETTWGDVVMVRINPRGVNMDDSPKKVVPVIEKIFNSGKGVYGMKILGNGRLAREAPEMIEYALKLGTIHAFTIGMNSPAQISQNVRLVEELAERYPIQPVNA
jgi:predicted aldo/keto reductase-like oxidoreductase